MAVSCISGRRNDAVVGLQCKSIGCNHPTIRRRLPMSEKKASVHWEGAGKSGQGQISTETGALDKYPYGFASRFGDDRKGTNPEEIVGAAHAACFTMAFSFAADKAGFKTESIDTTAAVRLAKEGDGFVIDRLGESL
jgi:osmotically inducible protein OsmC